MPREPTQSDRTKHPALGSSVLRCGDRGDGLAQHRRSSLVRTFIGVRSLDVSRPPRTPLQARQFCARRPSSVPHMSIQAVHNARPRSGRQSAATLGAKIDVPHARNAHLGGLLRVPWAVFRAHIQSNGSSGVSKSLASDSASGEEPAVAINSGTGLDGGPWVGIRAWLANDPFGSLLFTN